MLKPKKALEREALLKRIRELDAQIAQHERNLLLGEARLPVDDQLRLKLRRLIETNIPELAGKLLVEIVSTDRQKNDHAELDQFRFSVAPLMEVLKARGKTTLASVAKRASPGFITTVVCRGWKSRQRILALEYLKKFNRELIGGWQRGTGKSEEKIKHSRSKYQ